MPEFGLKNEKAIQIQFFYETTYPKAHKKHYFKTFQNYAFEEFDRKLFQKKKIGKKNKDPPINFKV